MKKINLGIKISIHSFNLIPQIYENKDKIDFIEIILLPDFTPNDLDNIKDLKIPYAIHLSNSNNGIDIGNIKYKETTHNYLEKINQNSDKIHELDPICYIIHPESGDINYSISNLKNIPLSPLALENMPLKSIHGGECLGYNPETLQEYFNDIQNLHFCFDITHAIKAAISLQIDYIEFIKKFLKFKNPTIFHLSGGTLDTETDEHLPLTESQYDLAVIKKILLDYDAILNLTFETPKDYEKGITDDLETLNYFLNLN
ncbi:MAG: hypothetical protein ACFFDN_51910 [Candidatus Hodarchaeota archaeon]